MPSRPSFQAACARYAHRYTMEHVPNWAQLPRPDGTYYAPQYASDREWYHKTRFPGEPECPETYRSPFCYSTGQSYPLGRSLDAPYQPARRALHVD